MLYVCYTSATLIGYFTHWGLVTHFHVCEQGHPLFNTPRPGTCYHTLCVVTGGTKGCSNDNLRRRHCLQMWQMSLSFNISVMVCCTYRAKPLFRQRRFVIFIEKLLRIQMFSLNKTLLKLSSVSCYFYLRYEVIQLKHCPRLGAVWF